MSGWKAARFGPGTKAALNEFELDFSVEPAKSHSKMTKHAAKRAAERRINPKMIHHGSNVAIKSQSGVVITAYNKKGCPCTARQRHAYSTGKARAESQIPVQALTERRLEIPLELRESKGKIIGRGGTNVKYIQQASGVKSCRVVNNEVVLRGADEEEFEAAEKFLRALFSRIRSGRVNGFGIEAFHDRGTQVRRRRDAM